MKTAEDIKTALRARINEMCDRRDALVPYSRERESLNSEIDAFREFYLWVIA